MKLLWFCVLWRLSLSSMITNVPESWIDPLDYAPTISHSADKVVPEKKEEESPIPTKPKRKSCPEEIYLKRLTLLLIKNFDFATSSSFMFTLTLSDQDRKLFADLKVESEKDINIHDMGNILTNFFTSISASRPSKFRENYRFYDLVQRYLPNAQDLSWFIVIGASIFLVILLWNGIPIGKFFTLLLILSFFWHWIHLYKNAVANKHAVITRAQGMPVECFPKNMTWMESFYSLFMKGDKCVEYQQALLVDPLWEVTPTMAVAETVSKFILHPLESLGRNIGKFFDSLLGELSWASGPVVLSFVFILILLGIVMIFGYRVRFPFFGSLEPSRKENNEIVNSLQKNVANLQKTIESLRVIQMQSIEFSHIQRIQELKLHQKQQLKQESSKSEQKPQNLPEEYSVVKQLPDFSEEINIVPGKHTREDVIVDECPPLKKRRNSEIFDSEDDVEELVDKSHFILSPPRDFKTKDEEFEWVSKCDEK